MAAKFGGEVSASIFNQRVNKSHDGFVDTPGREVGQLRRAATTSTSRHLRHHPIPDGCKYISDTGAQFLGSIIGDHTRSALADADHGLAHRPRLQHSAAAWPEIRAGFSCAARGWAEHRLGRLPQDGARHTGRRARRCGPIESCRRRLCYERTRAASQFLADA
jgi:hypothetical protein